MAGGSFRTKHNNLSRNFPCRIQKGPLCEYRVFFIMLSSLLVACLQLEMVLRVLSRLRHFEKLKAHMSGSLKYTITDYF